LRKQLKDEAKALKAQRRQKEGKEEIPGHDAWELTVGIEIHAQLNTEAKLFSGKDNIFVVLCILEPSILMVSARSANIDERSAKLQRRLVRPRVPRESTCRSHPIFPKSVLQN
jgi:hypothetical protein